MRSGPRPPRSWLVGGLALVLAGSLAACSAGEPEVDSDPTGATSAPTSPDPGLPAKYDDLEPALSDPVTDSVYPARGDDRVDSLHHELTLQWDNEPGGFTGTQRFTFRGTRDADHFTLDLSRHLRVRKARLDGEPVAFTQRAHTLRLDAPLREDKIRVLELVYAGDPRPVSGPTGRPDIAQLGLVADDAGRIGTMQEPYGALTWYAVNDQPSDKALYDLTLRVPTHASRREPRREWVGVSNGKLVDRRAQDGLTITEFRVAEPVASYLMTLAFGPYERRTDDSGPRPITYWTYRRHDYFRNRLDVAPEALGWLEEKLGAYPFDTLGFLMIPGSGGMETQTLITLGDDYEYSTTEGTIVHELAHQWWGDQVGPCDWRDLWMNEGMATYLETLWGDHRRGLEDGTTLERYARDNDADRRDYGPPGDYDPNEFAQGNVYFPPASMWHALRERLGDETFWELTAGWPRSQDNTCATREELIAWWSEESGEDLEPFFTRWLMGETDPD